MLKNLIVIGTRPEAIKLAPLVHAFRQRPDAVRVQVCVTAQHRQMMDQALARVGVCADHDLDVMTAGQTPSDVAAAVLVGMQAVLRRERPDWVIVQGDTTTTAAAALAAAYAGIKVAHIEAGLRTYDKLQPFPEEMNRCLVTQLADLHFAPTPAARDNLLREGVDKATVFVTGNTGIDALYATVAEMDAAIDFTPLPVLPAGARVVLATAHRRENLGAPFERICAALREVAASDERIHVVFPLHPRPEVREVAHRLLDDAPRVILCDPFDHAGLTRMMLRAELLITDSGGLQEEGPSLGRPVVVLRELTERPEAVHAGLALLVGADRAGIVAAARHFLDGGLPRMPDGQAPQCYGDGHAAERIVGLMLDEQVDEWVPQTTSLHK
jgi:UDP-N-acetylglucosamine 2-epimerase (non-hydrolysing)